MLYRLMGKKALVTGGTAGIGQAIAVLFAREGADVMIYGTNEGRSQETLKLLEEARVHPGQKFARNLLNVASAEEVEAAAKDFLAAFERLDILVNNAGITRDQLLMKMSEEEWDQVLAVNLKSVFNLCKAFARPMMKARGGKIINISSVIGLTGNAGQTNYAASKAGMIGFSKSLAKELASRGILVNCVAPGYIETSMTGALPPQVKEGVLSKIPLQRIGLPEEIAEAVLFFALANYITGQVLAVDGGMVI